MSDARQPVDVRYRILHGQNKLRFITAETNSCVPLPPGRRCREATGEGFVGPVNPSSGPSGHFLPLGEGKRRRLFWVLNHPWPTVESRPMSRIRVLSDDIANR